MEPTYNPLGHRANLLAQQRLQFYCGRAIIEIHHLEFESDAILGSRSLDQGIMKRLQNVFALEGCANLKPKHRVAATVSQHTLQELLAHTEIRQEDVMGSASSIRKKTPN